MDISKRQTPSYMLRLEMSRQFSQCWHAKVSRDNFFSFFSSSFFLFPMSFHVVVVVVMFSCLIKLSLVSHLEAMVINYLKLPVFKFQIFQLTNFLIWIFFFLFFWWLLHVHKNKLLVFHQISHYHYSTSTSTPLFYWVEQGELRWYPQGGWEVSELYFSLNYWIRHVKRYHYSGAVFMRFFYHHLKHQTSVFEGEWKEDSNYLMSRSCVLLVTKKYIF